MDLLNTSRVAGMDCMELEQELRTNVETGLRIGDALQRQVGRVSIKVLASEVLSFKAESNR